MARRKRAEDRREGRLAADVPLSFPAFDWCPRGRRRAELPARVDPSTPIDEIPMRTGARAALNSLGIFYLEDLSAISERELLVKESIGRHTAELLREVLLRVGLDFLPN
jgi:DNA-directed RNA polymerase alpha subunit